MPQPLSVLVVEDDPFMRALIGMLLEKAGHTAVGLGGALGASEIMKFEPFSLIVTDVVMPRMDGLEFIREVRKKWPALPIIAVSGDGDPAAASLRLKAASSLGATATLAKPFDDQEFLAVVARVLAPGGRTAK